MARVSNDPYSPWHDTGGWQLNSDNYHLLDFVDCGESVQVTAHYRTDGYFLELPGGSLLVSGCVDKDGDLYADLGGRRCRATVVRHSQDLTILCDGHSHLLTVEDPLKFGAEQEESVGRMTAPMPGKVVAVMVANGDHVERGAPLVVLEAMKMEHTITAPVAGTVANLIYTVGAIVSEGAELISFEAEEVSE